MELNKHRPLFYFPIISLIFCCLSTHKACAQFVTDAVVKVFVTSNQMDYYRPWQSIGINSSAGSGCIIKGNKILTSAHVVADQTFIQVKKNKDTKKYTAKVEAIGQDCDLALLSVSDAEFFEGVNPIELGGLPKLQETVTVLGYPQGGDKLSITEGVVSRIEVTSYSQSARKLLTVQIDAAINPGNSGGPVLQDGKLIGVAMQILEAGQNIGYMVPAPIMEHFFKDLEDGDYDGFPILGIDYNTAENSALRDYYGSTGYVGGILISRVLPFSPAHNQLKEGDLVLEIDGVAIGEDGTFQFRDDERLSLTHLITQKQVGEEVQVKFLRDKKLQTFPLKMQAFSPLVPYPYSFEKPPYFIFGGIVFTLLSSDLLQSWGTRWWEKAPVSLNNFLIGAGHLNEEERKEVVVILSILPDDINVGYHGYGNDYVKTVNGTKIVSFEEFVKRISRVQKEDKFTIIETGNGAKIILDNTNIDQINAQIVTRNNIPAPYSEDVAQWLKDQ